MASLPVERRSPIDRIGPLIGVAAIHVLIGYALIVGLNITFSGRSVDDSMPLTVVDLKPPPKLQPEPPHKPRKTDRHGGATPAPKTVVVRPVPVAAPPQPLAPLIVAPPIVTGVNLPGGGLGGVGAGEGSNGAGSGQGQGDGVGNGRGFSGAKQISGHFRNSDFPSSAKGAGRLKIGVRYAVGPSGGVDQCEIIEPSGYPEVDAMTCRVIIDRYRFKPARDEQGVPVTEVLEEDYSWRME